MTYDAVIVGAGHNGLVAANELADHGWSVLVLEAQDEPGGAVKSSEFVRPGFVSDRYSAFYPLGYASPVLRALELDRHGLEWVRGEAAVSHPSPDGQAATVFVDLERTMASLDAFAPGDGEGWRDLYDLYRRVGGPLLDALMTPFPPVRAGLRLVRALGSYADVNAFARFGLITVRRLGEEQFRGPGGGWLLAGNALHADLTPESSGGALFGWLLCMVGQHVGFPVPRGGSGQITEALVRRARAGGVELQCGRRVAGIETRDGRATGVRTADGERIAARRAVLADVDAPTLFGELLPGERHRLQRFQPDPGIVKVDWALRSPIPWSAPEARLAGTVHVADGMDNLTDYCAQLDRGEVPERPFLILGQYSMVDPSRCPPGQEVAWAYTHLPRDVQLTPDQLDDYVERIEAQLERFAPGFGASVLDRHAFQLPPGSVNLGTSQLHQQLIWRPVPGLGRPEMPVRGVYLASAAAHPGGGVHGGPGHNAARAAVRARLSPARLRPGRLADRPGRGS